MLELQCKLLSESAQLPRKANPWDAGFDLYLPSDVRMPDGFVKKVDLGLAIAIPEGHVGLLTIRSSLGQRGVQLANAPAVIDAGYRGELSILLICRPAYFGTETVLSAGDRVAQLVVLPIPVMDSVLVDELPESDGRGVGGFGSSGV